MENSQNVGIFLLWTITSFACHACAKQFLSACLGAEASVTDSLSVGWLLTMAQMVACLAMTGGRAKNSTMGVARGTHLLATLATNLSMAFMHASSTFAIKLMEPLTTAVVQYLTLGTTFSPICLLSLPVVVGGAVGFTGNPLTNANLSWGSLLAFASSIILAVRNVSLKKMEAGKDSPIMMRRFTLGGRRITIGLFVVVITGTYFLHQAGMLNARLMGMGLMCCLSAVFHVCYSYVSTGLVLTKMSVVSHAVANILKRLLVVLLLYTIGQRQATPTNFLSLVVCAVGLTMYTWGRHMHREDTGMFRRLVFVIGFLTIWTIVVYQVMFRSITTYSTIQDMLLTNATKSKTATENNGAKPLLSNQRYDTRTAENSEFDFTFNSKAHLIPPNADLQPDLDGYLQPYRDEINTFLTEDLVKHPERANFLSKKLKTSLEVIKEAQRLHFEIIGGILKGFKAAFLFDLAAHENKGDPCISVGEVLFLARINLPLVYYCTSKTCNNDDNFSSARELASKYSMSELVILVHGGGNIIGYPKLDFHRFKILDQFAGYQVVVFPQSVYISEDGKLSDKYKHHISRCEREYCCNENLTLVMRDQQSFNLARLHFNGSTRLLMAPDMAFQFGPIKRFMSPVFDVMWIRRDDEEAVGYSAIPRHPPHIRFHVSDWRPWTSNKAPNGLEQAVYVAASGMMFLARGRVVVTDRLHGHIIATLMDIPHVILDNNEHKLSAYHLTWTKSLDNNILTSDPDKAMNSVLELLAHYEAQLPPRVPFIDISENFLNGTFEDDESSYV